MSRKKRTKKRKQKVSYHPLIFLGVVFLLFVSFVAGYKLAQWKTTKEVRISQKNTEMPSEENYQRRMPKEVIIPPRKIEPPPKAVVAVIIDDIGYTKEDAKRFATIDYPITLSIIPFTPFDTYSAKLAHKYNKAVMVHLPMEPNHSSEIIEKLEKRTKGMLLTSMKEKTIELLLEKETGRIPFAVAANNHMGSKFTSNEYKMEVVLNFLKHKGLFFVDSRTSRHSAVCKAAKSVGVAVLKRDVFLDNSKSLNYILKQLDQLAHIALRKGYAIAIGHPHLTTYKALLVGLPKLEKMGIKVIPVNEIYEGMLEGKYEGCFQKARIAKR
ncbi:conserved hypothetical protein [Thermosulfidibacter takaii ABI70S6]|uniref:Divergent polysaccharide deacetylase family protein n=1 Tax=Thermosulfidibacter takaii (strain DSM 17441 / JCM 13301 / NBRC 103674 / ABI70S6) TaxID=1298851 RepID=A0A0S3QTM9_THET7|nr:divergent polysaccharide deacetylase family protein [Thermosulfidibacter takaii]BAT71691.1 conserved hypothetical protein [Thermosulfidibacter takaii ABI70S6]